MKKLMALCLSVLMVLSMCSFTVMAEETAVDFSAIANGQPANFVTGNLSLGENTITSSNERVIALDGTVTRPIYDDAKVTISINGGEAVEVTVKAKTANVLYANDFSSGVGSEWKLNVVGTNAPSAVADGKLYLNIASDTSAGRTNISYTPAAISGTRPVTMAFDMSDIIPVSSGSDIRISGTRYNAEGVDIGGFNTITVARCNSTGGFGGASFGAGSAKKNVTIKYDPTTGEFWLNGTKSTDNLFTSTMTNFSMKSGYTTADVAMVKITSFTFCNAGGGVGAEYKLDNFVYYEDVTAEDALASATPAEKLAHYESYLDEAYIANGANLDALKTNLKFAPDAPLPEGATLTWTSTDLSVIAADGTVNADLYETKKVTITGTLTIDGESVTKSYDVTVLPHTIVFMSETVDAENLTAGTSFAGVDNWEPASLYKWEVMNVMAEANGNKYFRISSSTYEPSGSYPKYTFKSVPVFEDGDTLVFETKFKLPAKTGGYGTNFEFYLNDKQMNEFIYLNGYIYDNDYTTQVNDYHGGGGRTDVAVTVETWYNLRMEVMADPDNSTGATSPTGYMTKCYINDRLVGTSRTNGAVPANITSASFRFRGRQNADTTSNDTAAAPKVYYDFDDIKVYTTRPLTSVLPSLSETQRVEYIAGLIKAEQYGTAELNKTFDLDKAYEGFDLAGCNTTVTWKSSNTEYITDNGQVLKLASIGQSVAVDMTATITSGDVTETVTFRFPIGIEGTTIIKTIDNEGLTGENGGAVYKDSGDSHGTALCLASEAAASKFTDFSDIEGGGRKDRLIFSTDYKFVPVDEGASGGIRLKTYAGAWGIHIQFWYDQQLIGLSTTGASSDAAASSLTVNTTDTVYVPMPEHIVNKGAGEWINVTVDYSPLSQSYQVYLDGVLLNEIPLLHAAMDLGSNSGNAFRGYGSFTSTGKGESWIDNMTLYKYTDADVAEVNAALNAALVDYASEYVNPVLTNGALPAYTIGTSWVNGDSYDRDLDNGKIKPSNVSTYKYVADGPAITWTIDGKAATEVNVASPKTVTMTVTATKNGVTLSKTFQRNLAPVAIRDLALGTADCLNGMWIEGATGTEKIIVGQYLGDALVYARVYSLADTEIYDSLTGLVKDIGISNPKVKAEYDQLKIFIVKADGITPLAYANASLHD